MEIQDNRDNNNIKVDDSISTTFLDETNNTSPPTSTTTTTTNNTSSSFLKNLVNTGTNLLFSSSSSITSPPGSNLNSIVNNFDDSKPLSFENDMSEGFETLCKRTEIGIDQCKELLDYFKKRAQIEDKYSKNVTNYFSKFKIKDENDSFQKGISIVSKVCETESNIHKSFSQNLLNNLCHPFSTLIKDMEQRRKNLVSDGQKLKNQLKEQIEDLKKSYSKYEKVCKEMESAKLELIEREPDANSIKVQTLERKLAKCESNSILAEEEYKNQINVTNEFISGAYQIRLSENLNEFEQFESMRLQFIKSNIKNYLVLAGEINATNSSVDSIDPENDIQHYIKNNFNPKRVIIPFQFESFSEIDKNFNSNGGGGNLNYASPLSNSGSNVILNNQTVVKPVDQITPLSFDSTSTINTTTSTNIATSSSPPVNAVQTKSTLKENIFGFFNKATTNLKSSTSGLLAKDEGNSGTGINQLSRSSGIPITNQNSVFGVELEELMDRQNSSSISSNLNIDIPIILMQFVQTLLKLNALEKEGIFATVPPHVNIQQEKQKLDQGCGLDHINDAHLVATLFKHWLRDLPNPLISFAIYDEILEQPQNSSKIIESGLPALHIRVLHYIIDFLVEFIETEFVKQTHMDAHSISMVLAPVLIRSPGNIGDSPGNALINSRKEISVIENMIVDAFEKKKTNNYILKKSLQIVVNQDNNGDSNDDDSQDIDDGNNSDSDSNGNGVETSESDNENDERSSSDNNGNNNSGGDLNNVGSKKKKLQQHHHFLYQTTPTSNVTPVLSSASDFFDECINSSSTSSMKNGNNNLPPRNSSNLSFDTFSTNQSDSEPVLVDYDNDDFDILSYK